MCGKGEGVESEQRLSADAEGEGEEGQVGWKRKREMKKVGGKIITIRHYAVSGTSPSAGTPLLTPSIG